MEESSKQLLLKDLCARLPYGVKFLRESWNFEWDQELSVIEVLKDIDKDGYINNTKVHTVDDIKPYLFPLSSMTEEEKEEYCQLQQRVIYNSKGVINEDVMKYINWCYKKHLDINNLIPMELAIDATGLNIYDKAKMNF